MAGTREELLAEAHRRIREEPGKYHPHVYGETRGRRHVGADPVAGAVRVSSASGRTWATGPLPNLTWQALSKVPAVVTLGGAALFGVFWITHRREEVAAAEQAAQGTAEKPGQGAGDAR